MRVQWCCLITLLASAISTAVVPPLRPEIHTAGLAVIDCIYNEQYDRAEAVAGKIITDFPDNPAGDFYRAVAVFSWMKAHFSETREKEFFRACEDAVEKSERIIGKSPGDFWARFFMAGVEGLKGLYEYDREHWISAFKWGWKGVSVLDGLKREEVGMPDLDYGIGSYEYHRSEAVARIWWMPRVEDKRLSGKSKLLEVSSTGLYTRALAGESLAGILLNEGNFNDASAVCDRFLGSYPKSRIFLLCKARALAGMHRFDESEAIFSTILENIDRNRYEELRTIAYIHFWTGKIRLLRGRYAESIAEFDLMRQCKTRRDSLRELKKDFEEEISLRKQAEQGRRNSPGRMIAGK
jgi:tetratricopeptide (TPR) repeat protein